MEDKQIIELYFERSEKAVDETAKKYGKYCYTIAYNILSDNEDSEECVNDTYLKAWNTIPPSKPNRLSTFLGKITRNLAIDRYKHYTAEKRGGAQAYAAALELCECVPSDDNGGELIDSIVLAEILDRFLGDLPSENRIIFMKRYWYLCSVGQIADDLAVSESKVKMSLFRSRNELKKLLEKEGVKI